METLAQESVPLVLGSDEVIRIGSTRVTLDTVLAAFNEGATAEEIVQQYPSLMLADVYQAIGYALRHAEEVKCYLDRRLAAGSEARASNETRWPSNGLREKLLARRQR